MNNAQKTITIFEYETLKVGTAYTGVEFTEKHRSSLETLYGNKGNPYYSLIHKGVKFNSYVGVLQVGSLIIEVLPKADKYSQTYQWRKILISMLRAVDAFDIHAPSSSSLSIKANSILDLYFELFISEVESLMKMGLIKKYRRKEGNSTALKGSIAFSKQLQKNLIHKERFYVRHTTYDHKHLLHIILYQCLGLLKNMNSYRALDSRIGQLILNFPEMKRIKINESIFNKVSLNKKTLSYKNALEISRLLLLNYHPDLSAGKSYVLTLMFDMNVLWERFIYVSLRKHRRLNTGITAQASKYFWKSLNGSSSSIRPDLVIKNNNDIYVIDTKWKNLGGQNPSPDDLRQLYVYHEYYHARKVALVYPGASKITKGSYYNTSNPELSEKECSVISVPTESLISGWQLNIAKQIYDEWLQTNLTD